MRTKIKYQINKNYNLKEIEIDWYKNKIIDKETLKNYIAFYWITK